MNKFSALFTKTREHEDLVSLGEMFQEPSSLVVIHDGFHITSVSHSYFSWMVGISFEYCRQVLQKGHYYRIDKVDKQ